MILVFHWDIFFVSFWGLVWINDNHKFGFRVNYDNQKLSFFAEIKHYKFNFSQRDLRHQFSQGFVHHDPRFRSDLMRRFSVLILVSTGDFLLWGRFLSHSSEWHEFFMSRIRSNSNKEFLLVEFCLQNEVRNLQSHFSSCKYKSDKIPQH